MIVTAGPHHLKDLVRLGELYYKESPYATTHKFESHTLLDYLRRAMIVATSEVAVCEWEGKIIGGAVAYLADYAWCSDVRVNMEFIYVLPEYRNLGHTEQLIDHMLDWSRRCQARELTAGDIGFRPRVTQEFYQQQGFVDPGVMLRKVL